MTTTTTPRRPSPPKTGATPVRGGCEGVSPRTVTIEIPLPPTRCMPNQGGNWRGKAAALSQYRKEGFYSALQTRHAPFSGPVRLTVAFYMAKVRADGRYRPRDFANGVAALKGAIDGVVDSGLIADDNHKVLTWGEVRFLTTKSEHGGAAKVVLTFEEIGETP